jgi:hypothetical protein
MSNPLVKVRRAIPYQPTHAKEPRSSARDAVTLKTPNRDFENLRSFALVEKTIHFNLLLRGAERPTRN